VCDDLVVTVDAGRVVRAEGACRLAKPWQLAQNARSPSPASDEGRPASMSAAVARAAEILRTACSTLIYGLSRISTDGQRAAISLAERLGATIDTTASLCHGPSLVAIQAVGESTCTLGEVRNRADLVVFWGSNPAESHPRHFERYSLAPPGRLIPRGRADRTLVLD
jgi:formylmethanofuran dehydrogenase subunit B